MIDNYSSAFTAENGDAWVFENDYSTERGVVRGSDVENDEYKVSAAVCRLTISIKDHPINQRFHVRAFGRRLRAVQRSLALAGRTRACGVLQPILCLNVPRPDFNELDQVGLTGHVARPNAGCIISHLT